VRPQDEGALADGIVKVLTNRGRYVRSRAEIEAVFGLEKTIDEYERLLQGLI